MSGLDKFPEFCPQAVKESSFGDCSLSPTYFSRWASRLLAEAFGEHRRRSGDRSDPKHGAPREVSGAPLTVFGLQEIEVEAFRPSCAAGLTYGRQDVRFLRKAAHSDGNAAKKIRNPANPA